MAHCDVLMMMMMNGVIGSVSCSSITHQVDSHELTVSHYDVLVEMLYTEKFSLASAPLPITRCKARFPLPELTARINGPS